MNLEQDKHRITPQHHYWMKLREDEFKYLAKDGM